MVINDVAAYIEQLAPTSYQESYDNSGLLIGSPSTALKGILVTLDVTPEVVEEAYQKAKEILTTNREKLDKLAMQLVEKEVIFREDLELIFGKRPFENVEENSINNTNSNIEEDTTDSKNISEKEVN